jgi:putative FmdB family regulatory protein
MPTYEYRCKKCGHHFELFHSIKDEGIKRCPRCKGRAERVPTAGAGILFKGSGFYITDYRSSSYKEKAKQEKSSGGSSGGSESGGGSSSGGSGGESKKKKKSSGGGSGGAAD